MKDLQQERKVWLKHYGQLVGKTVASVVRDGNKPECFALEFTDKTTAWIMCDPEGNGPGFLDIIQP